MKLSMWMIANRLSPLMDISVNIRPDAKPTLNSARVAYSTNTAHVYQSGDDVIVEGEGDQITIYDIKLKQAFEIIQGIFDYFQDWESDIEEAIEEGDYQRMIDRCWLVFQNPLMLMDANNKLLAITRDPELGDVDPEWEYLQEHGYSSLNSIHALRVQKTGLTPAHNGSQRYHFIQGSAMHYGGMLYTIYSNEEACGYFTLLEKTRRLNAGDSQLLERMAKLLETRLAGSGGASDSHIYVFSRLLAGKPYSDRDLQVQLTYNQWSADDSYQVCTLRMLENINEASLRILRHTIALHLPHTVVLDKDDCIHIISNTDMYHDPGNQQFRDALLANNTVQLAYSLYVPDISYLSLLERQTDFVLRQCDKPGAYTFADFGLNYLLTSQSARESCCACHPVVIALWEKARNGSPELFETLKTFLDCERSFSQSAAALFTHRNTVLYRVRKCQELLGNELDDPAKRLYIRISMQVLELFKDEL